MPSTESVTRANEAFDEHIADIVNAVIKERLTQNVKWGLQRHPTLDEVLVGVQATEVRHCQEFEIPSAQRAKYLCNLATKCNEVTWPHIAVEELAEAVEAAVLHGEHSTELREELVQLAAVVFAWLESVNAGQ